MKDIHFIMPMAGRGARFLKERYDIPKPLLEINGKPFFYWATKSIQKFGNIKSLTFIVLKEHIEHFQIDQKIQDFFKNANIVALPEVTTGAVITCLSGCENIHDDLPIVINDCDHMFESTELQEFCEGETDEYDGIILTFHSNDAKYSYVTKDMNGNAIRTVEKEVISGDAICGCYYFRNVSLFREISQEYLQACCYKEFYVSGLYNVMINHGMRVHCMLVDQHISFGTPEEYMNVKEQLESTKL